MRAGAERVKLPLSGISGATHHFRAIASTIYPSASIELSRAEEPLSPISLGLVERVVSRGSCGDYYGVAAVCEKFPSCWDTRTCVCPPFEDS
jgi:hypothetical protein